MSELFCTIHGSKSASLHCDRCVQDLRSRLKEYRYLIALLQSDVLQKGAENASLTIRIDTLTQMKGRSLAFAVQGRPVPWSRTRLNPRAKSAQRAFFKADNVKQYQKRIRDEFFVAYRQIGFTSNPVRLNCPVEMDLMFIYAKPKSSKRVMMTTKPDLDNLEKIYLDALNRVAYEDDCQVVRVNKAKMYGSNDHVTCIISWIEEAEIKDGRKL